MAANRTDYKADDLGQYFRRLHLFDNGDLLAIFDYVGLIRLDSDSNLLWKFSQKSHHDVDVDESGLIYTLGREEREHSPITAGGALLDDVIHILEPSGKLVESFRISECLQRSRFAPLLQFAEQSIPDVFHTNTLAILDGSLEHRSAVFAKGNLLVSFRNLNTIAIIDPKKREVVWALTGAWSMQHEPTLLSSGRLLIFDNRPILNHLPPETGSSRVVEFDPFTQEVYWEYAGAQERPLYSSVMGSVQRLPNGNTLITESVYGRAFEVSPAKDVVWEFRNPHTAGSDNEFVALVPELVRLMPDFPYERFSRR
jgi:hypothetical protein